jgi:hypothetical protein
MPNANINTANAMVAFIRYSFFILSLSIRLGISQAPLLGAFLLHLFATSWIRTTQGISFSHHSLYFALKVIQKFYLGIICN